MENKKTDLKNGQKILVYRYMWLFDGNENMCIKVLSGVAEEHEQFINALKSDERVIKACRTYLHEYDISLIEFYEAIKDKEKETEVENNEKVSK